MKRPASGRRNVLILWTLSGLLVAGCPIGRFPCDLPPEVAGLCWVQWTEGQVEVFELPAYRGDSGQWHLLACDPPLWYSGPALYEVNADGEAMRLTSDPSLTLDAILQLYDPAPRP